MLNTDERQNSEVYYLVAKRADGTIRQVLAQNDKGDVLAMGYFLPGTTETGHDLTDNLRYHWTDAFTDAELKEEMQYSEEEVIALRLESEIANNNKEFKHRK